MKNKLIKYDKKVNKFINILMPTIIILIPIIFSLYILNIHGYIKTVFRLDIFYRYTLIILVFVYIYKIIIKKVKITKSDIFLFIFMLFTYLSVLGAYNREIALYGYYNRYEGLFTLLYYCFLYLDCKFLDKKLIDKYIKIILSMALINLVISILQITGLFAKVVTMYRGTSVIGLTENANFLGSLMCLTGILSLSYFLLLKKNHFKDYIYVLITFIASYITLLFANSTGPFLSLVLVFIILVVYLFKKKMINYKKMIIVLLIMICLYPVILSKNDSITPEIKRTTILLFNQITGKNNNNKNEETNYYENDIGNLGNGRFRIWKNVFINASKRPILGYGPDNMGLLYKKMEGETKTADKAHNIYLNIFYSSGIFAMLGYLIWNIYCIYLGFKKKDDLSKVLAFTALAYCIQGLANINVIEVTPFFYFIIGFMMLLVNEKGISFEKYLFYFINYLRYNICISKYK